MCRVGVRLIWADLLTPDGLTFLKFVLQHSEALVVTHPILCTWEPIVLRLCLVKELPSVLMPQFCAVMADKKPLHKFSELASIQKNIN